MKPEPLIKQTTPVNRKGEIVKLSIDAATYFSSRYLSDLEIFKEAANMTLLALCPLALGTHLRSEKFQEIEFPDSFFACQYCLNLIAQALHSYFPNSRLSRIDYLDIQGCCHSFRGGKFSRPIDLTNYLNAHGIPISTEVLNKYTQHFITQVLPVYLPEISVKDFSERLLVDLDCVEIHPTLRVIGAEGEQENRMSIGELVRFYIGKIFHYCDTVDHDELSRLTDHAYSNSTFGINFPFCTDASQISPEQSRRYWTQSYVVRGETFRVSSQWYARHYERFCEYLIRLGVGTEEELALNREEVPAEVTTTRAANTNARYRGNAIGNAQNLLVRNVLSNLGQESFSANDWEATKDYFGRQCAYCGAGGDLVIDHIVPINRTFLGEHRLGNLVPSCRPCNASKASNDYREFLEGQPEKIEAIQRYMDSKNYVPLGDNEQVAMILKMAYEEVGIVADRYVAILNELLPDA
jgi:5-methylcytosine-specific restriction endonuclease McrA